MPDGAGRAWRRRPRLAAPAGRPDCI